MKNIRVFSVFLIILLCKQAFFSQRKPELPQEIKVPAQNKMHQASLPVPKMVAPGILFYETEIKRGPAGGKVWIYIPEKPLQEKLPCILIAPAGSRLIDGASLGESDRAEHLPYVRAGMVVVAYEIDGEMKDTATDEAMLKAVRAFKDSNAGLANQKAALDFALSSVSLIDADKIYAAGHSSAATHALFTAANEPRIKGVIAYAPATDIEEFLGSSVIAAFEPEVKGLRRFIAAISPINNIDKLKVPVFLFHSADDSTVSVSMTEQFADKLKKINSTVTFVKATSGDHYYSMINAGIPAAIAWIQGRSK